MLLYRFSGQIICNLDKHRSIFLSVVRFTCVEILEDISKPTCKHFLNNN